MSYITPDSVADAANDVQEPEAPEKPAKAPDIEVPMLAVSFTAIPAQAVWWLWKGLIPFRHVTLFVAPGKTGKGTTLADIIARITTGRRMPGDSEKREPMNVIIVAPEDDANEALRPRLEAAGADMSMVYNLTKFMDPASSEVVQFYVPDNVKDGTLGNAVDQIERSTGIRVGLVVFDPLLAIVTKSVNSNAAARAVVNPLEDFAKQPLDYDPLDPDNEDAVHPGLAVVLTQHTTKAGKTASSQGLVDASRMVLRIERTVPKVPDHPGRRIYVDVTNLDDASRSEKFALLSTWVGTDGKAIKTSHAVWAVEKMAQQAQQGQGQKPKLGYTVNGTPGQHAAPQPSSAGSGSKKPQATGSGKMPFRLIRRTAAPGAEPVLEPSKVTYESMAAAMQAAGSGLSWKHQQAPPGYGVYVARTETAGVKVSYVAWDDRERAAAEAKAASSPV
jgi:hypothetical protein